VDQIVSRDPEDDFAAPDQKGTAAAITVTAQISTNRSIVIQTYMDRDAPVRDYHGIIDKLSVSIDRQEAKANLEGLEAEQALEEKTLKQMEEDFTAIPGRAEAQWIAGGRKGQYKPSPQEAAQKLQAENGIKRFRESIKKRAVEIAKCRGVIAKVD